MYLLILDKHQFCAFHCQTLILKKHFMQINVLFDNDWFYGFHTINSLICVNEI